MAETSFARCRRVALFGLLLQLAAFVSILLLGFSIKSPATTALAWYILGGVPIWFVSLLVFRQHELAALERMDLAELRRERQGGGGGETLFGGEGGGELGFLIAATRLTWMQRWLMPIFGIVSGAYLTAFGFVLWRTLRPLGDGNWLKLEHVEIALVALPVVMLLLFLLARFASGMGRVAEWQLLRACGSFTLGNAAAALAVIIVLGAQLYAGADGWERILAYALPILMMLLGAETLLNLVFDIYRPRIPGSEPRAAFDSRVLGLIAEPGGIAHSVAEAFNYQFGFQVSQTWFYQLLQRAFAPLVLFGGLSLWALTCLVIVNPYELAIVEQFGRQLDPDKPLGPGIHWKLPWPLAVVQKFNTQQLHQIILGRRTGADDQGDKDKEPPKIVLWTDAKHGGYEEFNFIVAPTPSRRLAPTSRPREGDDPAVDNQSARTTPVHTLRMTVAVQYQIVPSRLHEFSNLIANPHDLLRSIAWQELVRFNASSDTSGLLGEMRAAASETLRRRIAERVAKINLGLDVVYVGVQDVHPEKRVADAYRNVITAEQEKVTEIRRALVNENAVLSRVAGDRNKALLLSAALKTVEENEVIRGRTERVLRTAEGKLPSALRERLSALKPQFLAQVEAQYALERARQQFERVSEEYDLGLGSSAAQRRRAEQAVTDAHAAATSATDALEKSLAAARTEAGRGVDSAILDAAIDNAASSVALNFWEQKRDEQFRGLEGEAAVTLAQAQANRWEIESRAATEVVGLQKELVAYRAAPSVYKARQYLAALADGIKKSRKYFVAFDPGQRDVRVRIEAQEQARPDFTETGARPVAP